jgi:hypothetical protein
VPQVRQRRPGAERGRRPTARLPAFSHSPNGGAKKLSAPSCAWGVWGAARRAAACICATLALRRRGH